jgi:hypothetical protein
MQEIFGAPSPELRQKLFALVPDGGALSELAVACLNAIDDIREHYGEAESEARHPDIKAGRPWPIVTVKGAVDESTQLAPPHHVWDATGRGVISNPFYASRACWSPD